MIDSFANLALAASIALEGSVRDRFRFLNLPPNWVLFLAIIPGILLFAWLVYRSESVSTKARRWLIGIRAAILFALVLVLCRPAIETVQVMVQRAKILVLLDDSGSMQRKDSYPDEDKRAAIAKAAGLKEGERPGDFRRTELVAKALGQGVLEDWRSRFDVELYRFSDGLSPVAKPEDATGRGDRTRIGEALLQAVEQGRGRFVKGIVLFSDGQSNEGRDPLEAARACAALGVPVHAVGVGDADSAHNIAVNLLEAPQIALEGDEITVTARVSATGFSGREVSLLVEEEESRQVLAERSITLEEGDGKRVALPFIPQQTGDLRLRVGVRPYQEETLAEDNFANFTVQVRPERIRVLYVEGRPRYEYRNLQNTLRRADRNLVVQCFLLSADRDFPQESTRGTPPLTALPLTAEELLKNYDVIILGDVDPMRLAPTPEQTAQFLASLRQFVEKGGGFLMIAGEFDAPRSYAGTPVEDLIPVVLGENDGDGLAGGSWIHEFHPQLENPALAHEICRLHPDPEKNRRLWEDKDGLRGFFWYSPVRKAKPAAEVLLRHPENKNRYGNHVLAAVGYFPEGRTMFLGFDETWRWKFLYSETYFERFWRNAIRYLALNRLRENDRRFRLVSEKTHYEINERALLEARVLDEDFSPSKAAKQRVFLRFPDGRREEAILDPVPGQPGAFRSSILLGAPGAYQAWIGEGDDPQGKPLASVDFQAALPSREKEKLHLDAATLQAIAKASAGQYLFLGSFPDLQKSFQGGGNIEIPVLPPAVEDLWDSAWLLGILVALLAIEWIVRKRSLLL